MTRICWVILLCAAVAPAQPQTHVVRVNSDGSFTPQTVSIRSGDTVRWEGLTRSDSIVRADGAAGYPALCTARLPFEPAKPNEFTGPLPLAPSGVFTLSPLDNGFVEAQGSCPGVRPPVATGDGGRVLCNTGGVYAQTMDSTWRSDQNTGTFIRLLWKDVNPARGVYDFTILRREMEQAVRYGKLFSLGVKAGDDGTPDWIFSAGVPRLRFQDTDTEAATSCGNRLELGNPARREYQDLYFAMMREVAAFVKSRGDWYRSLAYVKISGANLVSHENRLPNGCALIGTTVCPCNPQIFAEDGYRPSGLYAFYDAQARLWRELFPDKALNYALIQDGFPRVNETGGFLSYNGNSSNSSPLPGAFEQTQTVMDRGRQAHGLYFTVAHNGVGPKVPGCNFDGVHPKPERTLEGYWDVGSGCPNRWAVREGARGQITGYQTINRRGVGDLTALDLAFQNTFDNTDGIYLEIYEDMFWWAANANRGILPRSGVTLAGWADQFHRRRNDPAFPQFVTARNPFPPTYSYTFQRSEAGTQTLTYVHGMKCGQGRQEWGQILVDAQAPAVRAGGVVSASSFGGGAVVAPGSWIEIFGTSLASVARPWAGSDFNGINAPTALSGTSVRVGGQSAFVAYVSPGQVNAQVPSNVAPGAQSLTVTTAAGSSAAYPVTIRETQPGLLATPAFFLNGRQNVVAVFPDGSYALPPGAIPGAASRRARAGDTVSLYGIGFGPVTPAVPAGQVTQAANGLTASLVVTIGGQRAVVAYAGLAPSTVGLYQLNVMIPAGLPANDATPLAVTLGGVAAAQNLVLAIGN